MHPISIVREEMMVSGQVNSMQQSTQHCLPLQHRLGHVNQPAAHASTPVLWNNDERDAKTDDRCEEIRGLSVIEDRAYVQAMYTATYLFTLDYLK
jgi:hypothetical protein